MSATEIFQCKVVFQCNAIWKHATPTSTSTPTSNQWASDGWNPNSNRIRWNAANSSTFSPSPMYVHTMLLSLNQSSQCGLCCYTLRGIEQFAQNVNQTMEISNVFMNYAIVSEIASNITLYNQNTVINECRHSSRCFMCRWYQFNLTNEDNAAAAATIIHRRHSTYDYARTHPTTKAIGNFLYE